MAGYGNKTKWTISELLRRNEQSKALGQTGLSDTQIGSAMEGVTAAELENNARLEMHQKDINQRNRALNLQEEQYKDVQSANKIRGVIDTGLGLHKIGKEFNDPNSYLSKGYNKALGLIGQDEVSKMVRSGTNVPTEDMYGPNTINQAGDLIYAEAVPSALGNFGLNAAAQTGLYGLEAADIGMTAAEMAAETASWGSQAVDIANAASMTAEGINAATEAVSMGADAMAGASSNIPYVGIAIKLGQLGYQMSQGNYAQALADVAFGPLKMVGDMIGLATGSDFMNDAYADMNVFLKNPSGSTVICTELYRRGWLTDKEYTLDTYYGQFLGKKGQTGYHKFGIPIANYMKENDWFAYLMRPIGVHIARKLGKFILGAREPWYIKLGRHICKRIGG